MNKQSMTDAIVSAKVSENLTWEMIADELKVSPVWLSSACLGMNSASIEQATQIANYLELGQEVAEALTKKWDQSVPTDPFVYRLYEVVGVYGEVLKKAVQEKFGDGIMSAIDFTMDVDKEENDKGDRVVLTLNGKFLPYRSW